MVQAQLVEQEAERIAGSPHRTVLRIARLIHDRGDRLCMVRHMSESTMRIEANTLPVIGARLVVEFRSDRQVGGLVRWSDGRQADLEFDAPVDVAAMLHEDRRSIRRTHPRAPRFVRSARVRVLGTDLVDEGSLVNISVTGVCVASTHVFDREEPVVVCVEGLAAAQAHVRWSRPGETGLRLSAPLSFRALAEWLDARSVAVDG